MTKYRRRKIFYLLVATFLVAAPLLIAFSLGYTFDFSQGDVKKTGGIFIKSKIPRLSIFFNGVFAKETSLISGGALLTEISPATYLLRLEKEDYKPWSKTVSVKPEIVTELRDILLAPRQTTPATTTRQEFASLLATSTPLAGFTVDKKENLVRRSGKNKEILAHNVNSFGVLGEKIFFIDKNGFLAKSAPDTKKIETLGRPGFYLSSTSARFIASPSEEMAIIDSAGGVFLLDADGVLAPVGGGALDIFFDSDGEKMLIRQEHSVEVRWLADNTYQPFQKKGAVETILRLDSPIRDARWLYQDDAHIVIRTDDGIFLTELDGRGGRNMFELVSGKTDELLTGPELPDTIFFRKKKTWFKIEL